MLMKLSSLREQYDFQIVSSWDGFLRQGYKVKESREKKRDSMTDMVLWRADSYCKWLNALMVWVHAEKEWKNK